MLDKKTVIEYANKYAEYVTKEFSPHAIVLFGSYVKGNPHEDSDIDIAVVFNKFEGDWLKASARLWRMTEQVSLSIEPILLDTTEDKSGFVNNVMKTGQIIYKA
jgi:predicted nucleotidyltransferase